MGIQRFLLPCIIVFLLILTSCTNQSAVIGDYKIEIQKIFGENEYKQQNEIIDKKSVVKAIEILENAEWEENTFVSMSRYFDYQIELERISGEIQSKIIYWIWISPNKDKLEIIAKGQGKYVQLSSEDSEVLLNLLTQ
jgi:hypothetical protein